MEELSVILLDLLKKHYRVSLPGIGSFVVTDQSARIDEDKNIMLPPAKKVVFSKQETWNDGLLEAAYAVRFNLSEDEAQERIKHLMMDIRFNLDDKGKVTFPNFGCLRQGRHNSIELEQKVNIEAMLGLSPVPLGTKYHNKRKKQRYQPQETRDNSDGEIYRTHKTDAWEFLSGFKLNKQKIALIILAGLVGLSISVIIALAIINKGSKNEEEALLPNANAQKNSKLPNTQKTSNIRYTLPTTPEEDAIANNNGEGYEQPMEEYSANNTKTTRTNKRQSARKISNAIRHEPPPDDDVPERRANSASARRNVQYCVIIASHTSRIAAEQQVKFFKGEGYPNCHIAEIKDGRFRVAIGCYRDHNFARRELSVIKRSVNDAWILTK
jgi:nucleoid DNA-binding protein